MTTLWFGGTFYTMQAPGHTTDAVLTDGHKIVALGEDAKAQHATQHIDLAGAYVYPGFVDSHLHTIGYGEKLLHLDVSAFTKRSALLEALAARMQQAQPNEWVIAIGYNEAQFDDSAYPTLAELDALGDAHLIIKRQCHHLIIANSKALAFAGITEATTVAGGVVEADKGVLKDAALYLIVNHMPHITPAYIERALTLALDSLLAMGVTGGHSEDLSYYGPPSQPFEVFTRLAQGRFKAHLLQHHATFAVSNTFQATRYVALGAMKIFVDGAFGGHTAALSEPYVDKASTGMLVHTTAELTALVREARVAGREVAVHVIGDRAIATILDVFEALPPQTGQHDRIIHCSLINEALLARLARMPIIVDMQPQFAHESHALLTERLGESRMPYVHPLGSLLCAGICVAGGSDAPIEHPDPLRIIEAAITHPNPSERLTRYEAVQLLTTNAAHAIHERERGKIAPGFDADFSVFTGDIFSADLTRIHACKTVVDGRIVYDKALER